MSCGKYTAQRTLHLNKREMLLCQLRDYENSLKQHGIKQSNQPINLTKKKKTWD